MTVSLEWDSDRVTIHTEDKSLELDNGQAQAVKSWLCNMPDDRYSTVNQEQ